MNLNSLDNNIYDFLRDNPRFTAIVNQLQHVATEIDL